MRLYMIWYDIYDMIGYIWYDKYDMIYYMIYDMIYDMVWYDMIYDMIRYDTIWYDKNTHLKLCIRDGLWKTWLVSNSILKVLYNIHI